MTFDMDPDLTENALLSFNVKSGRGRLMIYLNGVQVFDGELDEGTPFPITLPSDILQSHNLLEFKAPDTGFAFWKVNEYQLESVSVTGDVLDVTNSRSTQFFYISNTEKLNIDTVKLKFFPNCDNTLVGPLKIYLNGDDAFSGNADCGVYNTLTLDVNSIFQDKNELEFISTQGQYLIDRVSVRTDLKDIIYPVYYFEVNEDLFDSYDELDTNLDVVMQLRFVNDEEKRLDYYINGRRKSLNTDDFKYNVTLNDYIIPGTNSIELIPKSVVDISLLKIVIDEN